MEYNQLDSLLKNEYNSKGDVPNEEGYSDFPGNINILAFQLESYYKILQKTEGIIPELVNPKYADEKRTKFLQKNRC